MDLAIFNEMLVDAAGVGLAVARADDLGLVFHNRRFAEWFPDEPGPAPAEAGPGAGPGADPGADPGAGEGAAAPPPRGLAALMPRLDRAALEAALADGRAYRFEVETRLRRRSVTLAVGIEAMTPADGAPAPAGAGPFLIVECQNISKVKELEYMIESYSKMIERQNRQLQREKERAEKLLLNIMPKTVYDELKAFGITTPQRFDDASILMLDFVGFTEMALHEDPQALIAELNDLFTAFDRIAEQFGCERIKTIGDAYMAVSGIPDPTPDHAQNIAKVALLIQRYLTRRNRTHAQQWQARIGIASGPVIGSIVGVQKYVYDIFGPGVNLAARMEALAGPMEIVVAESLFDLVRDDFRFAERGMAEVKGFGRRPLFTLLGGGDVPAF